MAKPVEAGRHKCVIDLKKLEYSLQCCLRVGQQLFLRDHENPGLRVPLEILRQLKIVHASQDVSVVFELTDGYVDVAALFTCRTAMDVLGSYPVDRMAKHVDQSYSGNDGVHSLRHSVEVWEIGI